MTFEELWPKVEGWLAMKPQRRSLTFETMGAPAIDARWACTLREALTNKEAIAAGLLEKWRQSGFDLTFGYVSWVGYANEALVAIERAYNKAIEEGA